MNYHFSFTRYAFVFIACCAYLTSSNVDAQPMSEKQAPLCHPNDCNFNGVFDDVETAPQENPGGLPGPIYVNDINENRIPDECETDCNRNGYPDDYDVHGDPNAPGHYQPVSRDVNSNSIPDECEIDCNRNGDPDDFDVNGDPNAPYGYAPVSRDANDNDIPDECEIDCNRNGYPDDFDVNGDPHAPAYYAPLSRDANDNDIPDECELDCNRNGYPDDFDISGSQHEGPRSRDENTNGVPDECERLEFTAPEFQKPFETIASSTYANRNSFVAKNVSDDDLSTFWAGAFGESPYELSFRFEEEFYLRSIEVFVHSYYQPSSIEIEIATGDGERKKAPYESAGWSAAVGSSYMRKSQLTFNSLAGDRVYLRIPAAINSTALVYEVRFVGVSGYSNDCNFNDVDDSEELSQNLVRRHSCNTGGYSPECEGFIDIDLNDNQIVDTCEADCNKNYVPDSHEISMNLMRRHSCNNGSYSPECEGFIDIDLNDNQIVDTCEADCNKNYVPDSHEITMNLMRRHSCNNGSYSPECEGFIDVDLNDNQIVDACEADCNKNYVPDSHEISMNLMRRHSCNNGSYSPECEGFVDVDLNDNEIVDACEEDCNRNFIPDDYEIAMDTYIQQYPEDQHCYYDSVYGYVCESPRLVDANDDGVIDVCQFCPAAGELCGLESTSSSAYENYARYSSASLFDDNQNTFWVSNFSTSGAPEQNTTLDIHVGGGADVLYIELDWFYNYGAEFSIEVRYEGSDSYHLVYTGAEMGSAEKSPTTSVVSVGEQEVSDIRVTILHPNKSVAVLSEVRVVGLSDNTCGSRAGRF